MPVLAQYTKRSEAVSDGETASLRFCALKAVL